MEILFKMFAIYSLVGMITFLLASGMLVPGKKPGGYLALGSMIVAVVVALCSALVFGAIEWSLQ
jgi:hypothetical protein